MSTVDSSTQMEQAVALLDADPSRTNADIARTLCCSEAHVRRARKLWELRTRTPTTMYLDLEVIRIDGGTQMRSVLDLATIEDYALAMVEVEGYGPFPPVDVVEDGEHFWLWNGFHRFHAAHVALLTGVQASVTKGTREDAVAQACGADARTPLPRDASAKRRAVATFLALPRSEGMTVREIADLCGVSHGLVHKMRQERDAPPEEILSTVDRPEGNGVAVSANGLHVGADAPPLPGFEDVADDPEEDADDEEEAEPKPAGRSATAEEIREERRAIRAATDDAHVDEVWLAGMPVRARLPEDRRAGFDVSALRWRRLHEAPWWEAFITGSGEMLKDRIEDPACPILRWLNWYRNVRHPRSWRLCKTCQGHGHVQGAPCPARGGCGGAGFSIIG